MAKKKKPASKTATRRTPRRGKNAATTETAGVGETAADSSSSASVKPTPPDNPSDAPVEQSANVGEASTAPVEEHPPSEPQTSGSQLINPNVVPTVVLHKKFGKYRCLFNNDDTFTRKYDIGSDSETNSSVEIRVVDPCASSESDSNAALDTQSDTNSGACMSPINSTSNANQSDSRDISPVPMLSEVPLPQDIPLPSDNIEYNNDIIELDSVPLPPPRENIPMENNACHEKMQELEEAKFEPVVKPEPVVEPEIPVNQDIPLEQQQFEYGDEDDDVITIVQIVEDDNPELYYNIKIDSPSALSVLTPNEHSKIETDDDKKQDVEFQKHFEELNIAMPVDSNVSSPMDCSDANNRTPPCGTPDLQFSKDSLDVLTRPDPSLTPSSTLSDDSNSSRVTEPNQNNSNDSAESSPTGVRRSSRIKTISNMKQKTKGYGLVKTPLKKALITQTKLKLEELGSDSQDKSVDVLLSSTPNSPSFPVPSEMPVKVKSRWRRSSELEMGTNSPASSPLASPSLPQRLQPISECQSPPEEEQPPTTPFSKESYDRIIEERMRQYQHLDENEYLCERMLNKETKKMICDCFLTKEELERGELACGEDCLNRLLMIEW